jgi:hypothetical protein
MAGHGPLDADSKNINPRILMPDSNNHWVTATDPVHFDKPAVAGVGPALGFANSMLEGDSKTRIGFIPCALGETHIRVWEPGQGYRENFTPTKTSLHVQDLPCNRVC